METYIKRQGKESNTLGPRNKKEYRLTEKDRRHR